MSSTLRAIQLWGLCHAIRPTLYSSVVACFQWATVVCDRGIAIESLSKHFYCVKKSGLPFQLTMAIHEIDALCISDLQFNCPQAFFIIMVCKFTVVL